MVVDTYYVFNRQVVSCLNIIVGTNIKNSIVTSLRKLGFTVYFSAENPNVLNGLSFHPDMQLSGCDSTFVCEKTLYDYYKKIFDLAGIKLICGETELSCNYPGDIAYNVKVVGETVFHKYDYTDPVLRTVLCDKNFIDVSQGYSGCSICKVSDNAIITADKLIHKRAEENGLDSLLISCGHIELEGFDYGFIGGASFYADSRIYFFGDVSKHPDFFKIDKFCKNHGTEIVILCNEQLTDYGGAITF